MIEDHKMIDNFLGIDTEGGGRTLDTMVFAIECGMQWWFFFFFKDRSSLQYFINTRDWSEFYVPYLSHYM